MYAPNLLHLSFIEQYREIHFSDWWRKESFLPSKPVLVSRRGEAQLFDSFNEVNRLFDAKIVFFWSRQKRIICSFGEHGILESEFFWRNWNEIEFILHEFSISITYIYFYNLTRFRSNYVTLNIISSWEPRKTLKLLYLARFNQF